ncbi:MAG TPA: serpin family protein [Gaiellaceae bacterium]|jgi:serpin B|nr:serpin family protein [Gaiellaceae bacterium]
MRRTLSLAAALAVTLLAAGCGAGEPSRAPDVVGADVPRAPAEPVGNASLAAGLNRFGFEFHRLLTARSPGENVVFSPLSIGMAFGMADAGARGETAGQIEDVFHLPGSGEELHAAFNALDQALADAGKSTLRLANRMYPATGYPLVLEFVQTLGASYGAPLERLDFAADTEAARERINGWVAERTENRIPELLPAGFVDPATVLVLVNALYLEAKWSQPFGKYPTETQPFTRLDGSRAEVPLMHNAELQTRYVDAEGYQAVELPYGQGELSMLVVVPEEGGFAEFERGFDTARIAAVDAAMRRGIVDLFLPRWSDTSEIDLVETLRELGLELPFDQARADFTGISPRNPFIGAGIHAADIEVDEHGTVAAAATALGFEVSGPPTPDAVIRADRPFLYLIRHAESGAVLFLGRVVDPS